jgi:hypothetical protein
MARTALNLFAGNATQRWSMINTHDQDITLQARMQIRLIRSANNTDGSGVRQWIGNTITLSLHHCHLL